MLTLVKKELKVKTKEILTEFFSFECHDYE